MAQIKSRIKGTAIQVKGGWGWKINIFIEKEQPLTMRNGDKDVFRTREEAVTHMKSHLPGIEKCLNEGMDNMMKNPNVEIPKEPKTTKDRKLIFANFIQMVYTPRFWEGVKKFAKYDLNYRQLKSHLLDKKPDPNIVLITGMDGDPFEFIPSEAPHLLDLPFATCVIESTDGTLFNMSSPDLPAGSSDVESLLVTEINGTYGFLGITEERDCTWSVDPESDTYKLFMTVTKTFCDFINSKNIKVGQSKTNVRFKHKKTGLVKIKKLIHISKTFKDKPMNPGRFNVDWSHQWEVRGHWRSVGLSNIGKDRCGNYKIKGFTWVKAHFKGPDDKELVKKIRMIGSV